MAQSPGLRGTRHPYSTSKVIHRCEESRQDHSPQSTVNNFARRFGPPCAQDYRRAERHAVTPRWKTNSLPVSPTSLPRASLQRGAWVQNEYSDAHRRMYHYKAFAEPKPACPQRPQNTMKNMNTQTQSPPPVPSGYAALVGLDWGDESHALSLCVAGSTLLERNVLEQTPEALAQWASALRSRFPEGKIAVALEQSRGALLSGLLQYEHLVAYPVNPKSLARFREALHPSRAKNDPSDADLLLEFLLKHRDHLRPWHPDTPATRQLALLSEQRRHFVDQRTALTNELLAHLKAIFPQALELAGRNLASPLALAFLKKWPTLQAVQSVKPAVLRQFYYGHNSRSEKLISQRLALVKTATPLTQDPALLSAHSLAIQTLVGQLAALGPFIEQHDQQIEALFAAHPDGALFDSLPGAGPVLAPRLLVALGSDRNRFPDALSVSCYSGIAPVTEKSGKTQHWVHLRWQCPKFLRQSWHEFARCSLRSSVWARACYDDLRKRMDHHEAIRKIAYKWQRIVWRMWQDHKTYDEDRYLRSLQKKGLAVYADLKPSAMPAAGG
jgi:transposase